MNVTPLVIGGAVRTLVQVHTNGACYLDAGSCVCSP